MCGDREGGGKEEVRSQYIFQLTATGQGMAGIERWLRYDQYAWMGWEEEES